MVSADRTMIPMVTVIIPTYNREKTIGRAIDSILNQTYKDIEIIVIDDGSSDGTIEVLKKYGEKVRVLTQSHRGANAARNKGIENANGKYIAFLDSDDEWLEDKIHKQIEYMTLNNKQVCFCPYKLIDSDERYIPSDYINTDKYEVNIAEVLANGNVIGTPTLILEKSVLDKVGGFDEQMKSLQDYELAIRISKNYEIGYIPEILVNAYRMNVSITNNESAYADSIGKIMKNHGDYVNKEKLIQSVLKYYKRINSGSLTTEYVSKLAQLADTELIINEYNKSCEAEKQYVEFINDNKKKGIYVFGTGKISKKITDELIKLDVKIRGFAISNVNGNEHFYGYEVNNILDVDRSYPIVVAVGQNLQPEIKNLLEKNNFKNYCMVPYLMS